MKNYTIYYIENSELKSHELKNLRSDSQALEEFNKWVKTKVFVTKVQETKLN